MKIINPDGTLFTNDTEINGWTVLVGGGLILCGYYYLKYRQKKHEEAINRGWRG